jgi:hypothetical protein
MSTKRRVTPTLVSPAASEQPRQYISAATRNLEAAIQRIEAREKERERLEPILRKECKEKGKVPYRTRSGDIRCRKRPQRKGLKVKELRNIAKQCGFKVTYVDDQGKRRYVKKKRLEELVAQCEKKNPK